MYTMKPVVVILGWFGSNARQLSKVAKIYDGLEVLTHTSPYHSPYIKQTSVKEANRLTSLIIERFSLDKEKKPLIFHTFSGQGCLIYTEMIDKANPLIMNNHIAAIHDSPSVNVDIVPVVNAVKYTFKNNIFITKPIEGLLKLTYGSFLSHVADREDRRHVKALKTPNIRRLFISSDKDNIVPQQRVIKFAKDNQFSLVQFQTPHVQHHRYHFEEYRQHILSFIESL